MIIKFFLDGIYLVISSLINALPVISFPSGLASAFTTIVTLVSGIGYFVPLNDFAICFLFCFAMYKLSFLVDVIHWFLRKIPGIS